METNLKMKTNNASLWNKVAKMFRRETREEKTIREMKVLHQIISNDATLRQQIAEEVYCSNHGELISDLRESIDIYEICQEFDTYDIAQELVDDVVYNLDMCDIAEHIDTEEVAGHLEDMVDNRVSNNVQNLFDELDVDSMLSDRVETLTSDIATQISDDIVGEVIEEIASRMVE
tara:strand:+ start:1342 stop:1866 length:525 start_codon:yes stop_codon:yes gene_type:complete